MPNKARFHKRYFLFSICIVLLVQFWCPGFPKQAFAETSVTVTDFAGLQAAVNGNTGQTIEIASDINFSAVITVNKDLTFKAAQGADNVRLTAAGGRHFNISGGDITLTFDGNVVIDGGNTAGGINCTSSSLTLNNAVIQNNVAAPNGGGIFARSRIIVNDCVFSDNTAGRVGSPGGGGAIWTDTDITVYNSTFARNRSFSGGAILSSGNLAAYGSVFTGNIAQGWEVPGTGSSGGGAIFCAGNVVIDNCAISGNKSGNGGGICSYHPNALYTIALRNGTTITDNESFNPLGSCGGGAIYSSSNLVTIDDSEVTGNTSVTSGGAVYTDGGLVVTSGVIRGNTAGTGGGAARVYGPVLSVSGGEISGNTAGRYGGAIMTGAANASVSGTARIIGNTSNGTGVYDGGGGFSLYYATLNVSGGEISGNVATGANGGGIGDYWGSAVNVTGGAISDNHAPNGDGGGIYINDLAKVTAASGALFSGNTASRAFWMTDPADITLHHSNIHTTSRSAPPAGNRPFTYLFNNYDVNYLKGNTENPLPLYSITVTDDGNGVAGSDKNTAYQGETVTLTATPNAGHRFKQWIVVSGNIAVINNDGAFIMPDSDVVIQAIFEPNAGAAVNTIERITGVRVIGEHLIIDETAPPLITIPDDMPPLAALPELNPDTGASKQSLSHYERTSSTTLST